MAPSVRRANESEWLPALELLYQHLPADERRQLVAHSVGNARQGSASLDELWIAISADRVIAVLLQTFQPGKVAFVWPVVVQQDQSAETAESAADSLLQSASRSADAAGIHYSQLVLEPFDQVSLPRLTRNGFRHLSELLLLQRSLRSGTVVPDYQTLKLEPFTEDQIERLARLLELTFQQSLDCPEVASWRTGRDAVTRHLTSSPCSDRHWFFARDEKDEKRGDVGVLLLVGERGAPEWEIDYFGVVPAARGQRIGKQLVSAAIRIAAADGASRVAAVVDSRNHYAITVYDECQFEVESRRQAVIRLNSNVTNQFR